jgi:NAD(P)-dependent dehydrogenase (short-subunit alcohol dehydrogenase family)
MPSYYASKHGVVGLVKAAAAEFAPHRIRVNAVCPGVIDTPILGPLHGMKEFTEGIFARLHLLNRVGQPEEVAELVVFLASERAAFVTGSAYPIDGGITASITSGGASGRLDELG